MFDRYLRVLLDCTYRHDVEMQRALLDAVLHLGVRLAAAPHKPRVVPVCPRIHAHFGAVAWQTIEKHERSRPLDVLPTALRILQPMLGAEHIFAA